MPSVARTPTWERTLEVAFVEAFGNVVRVAGRIDRSASARAQPVVSAEPSWL
jgi:hypothetical protein